MEASTAPESAGRDEFPTLGQTLKRWFTTTDHKEIGILYIVTSFSFFLLGGVMALLMRTNLAFPGAQILDTAAELGERLGTDSLTV